MSTSMLARLSAIGNRSRRYNDNANFACKELAYMQGTDYNERERRNYLKLFKVD